MGYYVGIWIMELSNDEGARVGMVTHKRLGERMLKWFVEKGASRIPIYSFVG